MVEGINAANKMVYHPKTESGKKTGRVVGAGMFLLTLPNSIKVASQLPQVKALPKYAKMGSFGFGAVLGAVVWGLLGGVVGNYFDKQHDAQCKMFNKTV